MIRKIIQINQQACNGCGLCAAACHEGAIAMVKGKATLLRDDYCDGLGDCLPTCPTGAITFTEREAAPYDQEAVLRNQKQAGLCFESQLRQWPVQIKLVPTNAPYFQHAHLLIAADCTAFAYGDFHRKLMGSKITLIGCPKLDSVDYTEKLTEIIRNNEIQSVTVVRMEVPCCSGIEAAVKAALQNSQKFLPWQIIVISTDGRILQN